MGFEFEQIYNHPSLWVDIYGFGVGGKQWRNRLRLFDGFVVICVIKRGYTLKSASPQENHRLSLLHNWHFEFEYALR
jgi:hypothetical protein